MSSSERADNRAIRQHVFADQEWSHLSSTDIEEAVDALKTWLTVAANLHKDAALEGREGAILALAGVCEFARARFGDQITTPIFAVHQALRALDTGTVVPLMKKKGIKGAGNRSPDSEDRNAIKSLAAVVAGRLMQKPHAMTKKTASELVAQWLNELEMSLPNGEERKEITWKTVQGWRDAVKSGKANSYPTEVFEQNIPIAATKSALRKALESLAERLKKPPS